MFPRFEKAEQMNGSGSDGAPAPWIVRACVVRTCKQQRMMATRQASLI